MNNQHQETEESPSQTEAMREELERYRALCELMYEGICVHEDGIVVDVNPALCKMFGYSFDEMIGKNIMEFAAPESKELLRKNAFELLSEEPYQDFGLKKDGTRFPAEVYARTISIKDKQFRIAVVRDLTRQHEAEKALRESERKYRHLMKQAPDAVFVRNRDRQIIDVNKQACKLTGYKQEELLQMTTADFLLTPETLAWIKEQWIELDDGKILIHENPIKHKDGSLIDTEASLIKFEEDKVLVIVRDISKRKQAERALDEHLKKYESCLSTVDGIVWEVSLNPAKFTFVSNQVEKILGYPPECWLESVDFWRERVHSDDREQVFAKIDCAIESLEPCSVEFRIITADGRTVWLRGRVAVEVKDEIAVALRGVIVEYTKEHLAQEQLRKFNQMMSDSQQIGEWGSFDIEIDDEGNLTENAIWSDEFYRIFGLTTQHKSVSFETFFSFVHPDDKESIYDKITKTLQEGRSYATSYRIIRPDGQMRYLTTQGSVIKDKDGKPLRLVGATHDVTEQEEVEIALRESEVRYRAFIKNSSEGIFRYDIEPPMPIDLSEEEQIKYLLKHGIMRECNEAAAEMQGFNSVDDILGLSYGEIVEKRGENTYKAGYAFINSNYRLIDAETISTDEGDAKRYFRLNLIGEVEDGKLIRGWATQREVTKQKRAELKLEATSEHLRALSARVLAAREEEGTRIAREIHDELGTALTGLRWDLEWIEQKLKDCSDVTLVKTIQEKIKTAEELIDNTIGVVRRISSEFRPRLLDNLGLVAAIDWYAKDFQKRTGIVCNIDSALEDIELHREKATAIFRIFQEILTNILRHSEATIVEMSMEIKEDNFILEVKDNGKGITEEHQQGADSLGILGMKERAYLIGGKIFIDGQNGKGTTVRVCIPIK